MQGNDQEPQAAEPAVPRRDSLRVARGRRPGGTRVVLEGPQGAIPLGGPFVVMAGPCAVEGREPLEASARAVGAAGCAVLRGGAFKPRTSPYSFQGMGEPGVRLLVEAGRRHGLATVSEIVDAAHLPHLEGVDLLQVGARNMQNFALLRALSRERRPVLLKRGPAATVEEWLLAAEYLLEGGNDQVVLCERGIRTFETSTRYTLDLSSVAVAKQRTHLPVIVDPSHAAGQRDLVLPLALAAAAAGADGLLLDVHADPASALCDGPQALLPQGLQDLMTRLRPLLDALGRELWLPRAAALRAAP